MWDCFYKPWETSGLEKIQKEKGGANPPQTSEVCLVSEGIQTGRSMPPLVPDWDIMQILSLRLSLWFG